MKKNIPTNYRITMTPMPCSYLCLVYIFFIIYVLPTAFGNYKDDNQLVFDSIVQVVQMGATVSHVCYLIFNDINQSRRFLSRKKKCLRDNVSELGPRYVRRSYRMTDPEFWDSYNTILTYYPKRVKIKNKTGKL